MKRILNVFFRYPIMANGLAAKRRNLLSVICMVLTMLVPALWLNSAFADEIQDERIQFIESYSAECEASGGSLISIKNQDSFKTIEIWLERWLSGMPTGEHKKYVLLAGKDALALGCSSTTEGDQHWKITDMSIVAAK